jgi:hypothetical protein
MQYPTSMEVENCLKGVASEIGDTTDSPFRVDVVARYGGKPPLYTVVIRSAEKEPIRRKLAEMLNRKFSLGGTSFALDAHEAQVILQHQKKGSE